MRTHKVHSSAVPNLEADLKLLKLTVNAATSEPSDAIIEVSKALEEALEVIQRSLK